MNALPGELEQAAEQGSFRQVLSEAFAALSSGPEAAGLASSPAAFTEDAHEAGGVTGGSVVAEASEFLGTPYVWGGNSPTGFDCSGLVQYVYGQLGIALPRTSQEQVTAGTAVASLTQATPGDLVFFAGSDGTATSPGHVGIYIGTGKMIDAPYTGTVVQIQTVSLAGPVVAIRQIVPSSMSGTTMGGANATSPSAVPSDLASLFVSAGGKYGVSPSLLAAVARQESGFTPNVVSTAGAEGLMQLMPGTAAGLGITPFTPREAIDGAAQLLSGYIQQFGSVPLALAAYNAGPGAVEEYGGIPPYPQTVNYVSSILQTMGDAG